MSALAIDINDAFRIYQTPDGDAPALQGVTLHVPVGEILAIVGPSGSGKSTLLRILAGLERPDAGSVEVLGERPATMSRAALSRFRGRRLGVVEQHAEHSVSPDARCRDAVAVQLQILGEDAQAARRRADDILARVGLADVTRHRVRALSGGQRQRVAVAAAMAHGAELLLADEPTGELDARSADEVHRLIASLVREHGTTAVLVSHDDAVGSIADRVITIADGRFAAERAGPSGGVSLVVSASGWVQLPRELRARTGVGDRVDAISSADGLVLRGDGEPANITTPAPASDGLAGGTSEVIGRLDAVTVRYPGTQRPAVSGLTLELSAPSLAVMHGPSGSGKTTVLNLLAGLVAPTEGQSLVAGVDLATLNDDALADLRRDTIGMVEQDVGLVPFLTARENVAFGLAVRGRAGDGAVDEWLLRLGLAHRAAQRVERLSGGERQRVALARALVCRPRLLLVDEPTSRLDRTNAALITEVLADYARSACVLSATHDADLIARATTRIALTMED